MQTKRSNDGLIEELKQLESGVPVECVGELGYGWGDLQSLMQDNFLALEADIFGPLDETGEVRFWANILTCRGVSMKIRYNGRSLERTDSEVLWSCFKQWVLLGLGRLAHPMRCGRGLLAGSCFGFGRLVIETRISNNSQRSALCHRFASEL